MGTEHALRNIQELKLTLKILVQYLRSTLLQGPSPTAADIQGLFDLLLVFVTQRTGGMFLCLHTCLPMHCTSRCKLPLHFLVYPLIAVCFGVPRCRR
jgi:hypothetical protein